VYRLRDKRLPQSVGGAGQREHPVAEGALLSNNYIVQWVKGIF